MGIPDKESLFSKLAESGEQLVRENLAQGIYGNAANFSDPTVRLIYEWLRLEELARTSSTAARAESAAARAEAAASADREFSRTTIRKQLWLTIIATIAAAITITKEVIEFVLQYIYVPIPH